MPPTLIPLDLVTQRPTTGPRRPLRVALVNMPFSSARYPSIQLGLLQAILKRRGFDTTTHYFNLRFAPRIGWDTYELLCHTRTLLTGEWVFAGAAFGECAPAASSFLERFSESLERLAERIERRPEALLDLRERIVPAFLEECLESVRWDDVDVVGFGSVFEQNCAALALARLLKERHPHIVTVFGGSNFEDTMGLEYVRALPWIDYAVIGEGDEVFPALLDRLATGDTVAGMAGVARRGPDGKVSFTGRAPTVRDLDSLPDPDYADYFATAVEVGLPRTVRGMPVMVPFETSRGCWWGAKHHCTFCGLNGSGMAYRSKSPERVLAGVDELARRHHVYSFEAVDNILDHRYIEQVFAPIAEQRKDYTFFYEVKANLSREHLRTLARGGIRHLQPGIESLSTPVLKLMNKGTTGIQNVRFLKWAQYYGIRVSWNVLYGFPGETEGDYATQLATMRLIPHLQPPTGAGRIWLERYSPYFGSAAESGFCNVRAEDAYEHVYPDLLDRSEIAYFFQYDAPGTLPDAAHEPEVAQIDAWRASWQGSDVPALVYQRGADRLTVIDGRVPAAPRVHLFDERAARVYEICGPTGHTAARVRDGLRDQHGIDEPPATVQRILDQFGALGLMLHEDGSYLSLALPSNPNW